MSFLSGVVAALDREDALFDLHDGRAVVVQLMKRIIAKRTDSGSVHVVAACRTILNKCTSIVAGKL
jgi:hypothetical protein